MAASLLDIKGIGPTLARLLAEAGFSDLASVAAAETKELTVVNGIGERTARAIHAEAVRLLAGDGPGPSGSAPQTGPNRKKKAKKLRKQAKQLRAQAKQLTKKAEKTKSKKKRKRRLRAAAQLQATAERKRRQAEKLLSR